MMKKLFGIIIGACLLFSLLGCSRSLLGTPTPLSLPTLTPMLPSATALLPTATSSIPTVTLVVPTITPGTPAVVTGAAPTATLGPVIGYPPGPYRVIRITPPDVLNIRSGPGVGYAVTGSFATTAVNILLVGPSTSVEGVTWVQVQNPSGGTGWVNATYLTEYYPPDSFCGDPRVNTLISNLTAALKNSDGLLFASLVSPAHGVEVRYWRYYASDQNIFDTAHARAVFESTYSHNWGPAAGSGIDTVGSFHEVVLPKLLDVFNSGYTLNCNSVQTGGASYDTSWPVEYAHLNFYSVYRPGAVGDELNWRTWLVGVEYVNGQPYLYTLIQMAWEP